MDLKLKIVILLILLPSLALSKFSTDQETSRKQVKTNQAQLLDFKDLSALVPKHRKNYLRYLLQILKEPQNFFLTEVLLSKNQSLKTLCHPALFGREKWIENTDQSDIKFCHQSIESASQFFKDPRNQLKWNRLRISLYLICTKSSQCKSFNKKLLLLNKKALKTNTRRNP